MLRVVSLSLLAAVGVLALAAPAAADHRWRHRHTFFPLMDVFPGGWDEDEYAHLYDEDEEEAAIPRRVKRNLRAEDKWWLYGDDEDLEPVVKKPVKKKPAKKTVTATKKPPKPVAKLEPQTVVTTTTTAAAIAKPPALETAKPVASVAKVNPTPLVTKAAAATGPAPLTKTIGCTSGAAIVTNYGFADVKPKTCSGDTFAYTASRGGKSFLIKLTASSGEVIDVKKL